MKNNTLVSFIVSTVLVAPLLAQDDGHGHAAPKARTLDELFTVKCECKVLQYTCDECRYELGLVKIDPSLIRSGEKPGGLFKIEPVEKHVAQTLLPLNGEITLNGAALTHVSPRVPGTLRTIQAELGKRVEKGAVLFEIESSQLGLAVGAYRKNKALAALALKNLEREKALVEKKISPEADRIEAQMKYDEYRIELESAENALAVMGLDAAAITALTADGLAGKNACLPILAPQSGTIIQKHLDTGETIEAGKEVLTIADLSSVWVWLSVYEQDLSRLLVESKKGAMPVRITTCLSGQDLRRRD